MLRFDKIDSQRVPKAVLTVMRSHVIKLYLLYAETCCFQPLSESSLWKIISELKLTQKKVLSGLDNVTAAGLSSMSALITIAKDILTEITQDEKKYLLKSISEVASYLKLGYKVNCSEQWAKVLHLSV